VIEIKHQYTGAVLFTVQEAKADNYDPGIRVECTAGIHFFMTRREAEEY
jgi:hypothetical protein